MLADVYGHILVYVLPRCANSPEDLTLRVSS